RRIFSSDGNRVVLPLRSGSVRAGRWRVPLSYTPPAEPFRLFNVSRNMMTNDFLEWLHLAARWIHVFAGILWVGQTYFFTWLDRRFVELAAHASAGEKDQNVWM